MRRHAHNRSQIDLRMLAKSALSSIEKKLRGIHRTSRDRVEKEVSTSNLVQMLIQEATDNGNLASHGGVSCIVVSDFLTFVGENVSRVGSVALTRVFDTPKKVEARLAVLYILYKTLNDQANQVSCLVQLPPEPF
jgi:hypothetical protein